MGFFSFAFKTMWQPNGLSQSFEILHEQMVGYLLLGKSNLNFQKTRPDTRLPQLRAGGQGL